MTSPAARSCVWAVLAATAAAAVIVRPARLNAVQYADPVALLSQVEQLDPVDRLVVQYAPLLYLHRHERWRPGDVDTFLSQVDVADKNDSQTAVVNGSLAVGAGSQWHHLIATPPRGVGTPDVQHEPFLAGAPAGRAPVYVAVTRCDPRTANGTGTEPTAAPSFHATYWTFHPFNEGKRVAGRLVGNHVGDWEHVSVRVLNGTLKELYVSSHDFGAYYTYCTRLNIFNFTSFDSRGIVQMNPLYPAHVHLDGTHPVMYVARGSHGLWPTPGEHVYLQLPHLVDETSRDTAWPTWRRLVLLSRVQPQWLQYRGRWGNPRDCWRSLDFLRWLEVLCDLVRGPVGIGYRRPHFQC